MHFERIFIGMGSNIEPRVYYLQEGLRRIGEFEEIEVICTSSIYQSAPVGVQDQSDFLNLVAEVRTSLTPELFLMRMQNIERELGRVRTRRWGPRTLDIDLLYWGARTIHTRTLRVPHPEIEHRKFVLQPLTEIAPDFAGPPRFTRTAELLRHFPENQEVSIYQPCSNLELS